MGTVLVIAAFALPGVARAHGGWNYTAGTAGTAPTIDGMVNASEWADATEYPVSFGAPVNANGTVRFVHNGGDLYVAAVVQDASPSLTPLFDVRFDNDHDGTYDSGDDAWLSSPADFFYDPAVSSFVNDLNAPGGTQDTVAARTIGGGAVTFELRHPLCSVVDAAHDVCASFGQTLGVNFQYARTAGGIDWANAPGGFAPATWANLTLAAGDAIAPSVTVTAPAAGSVLSGSVAVAATATDNVGVTAVVFRYFGGALPYVELGTDTTAPYTATFDSTQVPNTVPLGGTVYAFARDAAGNETGVGNGVTVSNVPGGQIFFETNRDGNSEIYSMTPAGTGLTRLTTSVDVPDSRPSVSPNGSKVAWQAGTEIWLMNSDGTNKQPLATIGTNGAPAFSPDGTKIAFESKPDVTQGTPSDVWVMNADGTGKVNLTNSAANDGSPTWSPNGMKIAFHSNPANGEDIFTMNADGSSPTPLPANSGGRDADPDWSPDGQKILFVSNRTGPTSVWSVNLDGTGLLNVTSSGNFDADPAWSPDGSYIVFTRDNIGGITFNVWIARANGTGQVAITNAPCCNKRNSFADWGVPPSSADLVIDSIAFTAPAGFPQPNSYTVTVRNAGGVTASLAGVVVQGYYSADTVVDGADSPACGNTMSGTLAAGATTPFVVGCSGAPTAAHNYLLVQVDISNALVEGNETNNLGIAALNRLTAASISITGDPSASAGAASAAIAGISIDAIRGATSGPSATPLGGIPLGGIPLGGIPLGGIPLGGIPLGGIPLGGIGFTSANLDQNGLGGVPLSTIPLESTSDTWQKRLDANAAFKGTPVQSVTLAQVLGTSVVTSPTPVSLD
ncbi:MAG: Ig-like domain-containing protein, partial [Gaiellaceae bacterium]